MKLQKHNKDGRYHGEKVETASGQIGAEGVNFLQGTLKAVSSSSKASWETRWKVCHRHSNRETRVKNTEKAIRRALKENLEERHR